jgi:hypothetical protein
VKTVSRSDSSVTIGGSSHIPWWRKTRNLSPVTELDGQEPEFLPPRKAKLVASFPNPFMTASECEEYMLTWRPRHGGCTC